MYSYGLGPEPPGQGSFTTLRPIFEQSSVKIKRQRYIPNFKQLRLQFVLDKYHFKYILLSDSVAPGRLEPGVAILTNSVKVHMAKLHTKYQASSY